MELKKYHFVASLGKLLRLLGRAQHLFPAIQPACSRANHLLSEGKELRDMIEHSDAYEAGRGKFQNKFVREAESLAALPGSLPGVADATGTIVDQTGHWLGGRLNVERVLQEISSIREEALRLPAPGSAASKSPPC
jgi:hypothetical protein